MSKGWSAIWQAAVAIFGGARRGGQEGGVVTFHPMPAQIPPFPHLHVRPQCGWVNDPNGIGHWDGQWHVMYQWNPNEPRHRDVHWGHMTSPDLLSWRDEGIALRPRPDSIDAAGVWSGVAVQESAGVALVYTAVPDHAHHAGVAVARQGVDGTWTQPDRTATEHPDLAQWLEVRDPFIVSVAGRRFGVMGAGTPGTRRGAALVYDADDLDHWSLLGALLVADELPDDMTGPGAIWECPQLLPIGDRWLLVVSWDDGATTPSVAQAGSSARRQGVTGYVGDLDVTGPVPRFLPRTETAFDHGPDFYAPQLVADGDRLLAWGWSWEGRGTGANQRDEREIAESGWAGTLTFPREVVIDPSGRARCVPARELDRLVGEPLEVSRAGEGWSVNTSEPAWTFATGDSDVVLDLVDSSTGSARPIWSTSRMGPTRAFIDGSIVELFNSAGSTTVRAYPAPGELWRVRSSDAIIAAELRIKSGVDAG